jgi:hypothetical protein
MKTHPASAALNGQIKKTVRPIARDLWRVADMVALALKNVEIITKKCILKPKSADQLVELCGYK